MNSRCRRQPSVESWRLEVAIDAGPIIAGTFGGSSEVSSSLLDEEILLLGAVCMATDVGEGRRASEPAASAASLAAELAADAWRSVMSVIIMALWWFVCKVEAVLSCRAAALASVCCCSATSCWQLCTI